jgi:HD-GYP domain-containing protein (c-di-GMP phosphodiesterase class II)
MSNRTPESSRVDEQTLKYAEEFSVLYANERSERQRAEDALATLEASYATTVRALAAALELRDDATGRHAERVTALALALTQRVDSELAADPALAYGYLLHDIGKIGIPDALLLKPACLEPDELGLMRTHPELGERIVAEIPYLAGIAREVIASHHERWDGSGYPKGLAGDEIPLAARIFAIADAYDAMTSNRPYRTALTVAQACEQIAVSAGTHFDPELVRIFLEFPSDGKSTSGCSNDGA